MANAQAWTSYAPFGDTLGAYAISLQGDQTAWILGCRNDGHNLGLEPSPMKIKALLPIGAYRQVPTIY